MQIGLSLNLSTDSLTTVSTPPPPASVDLSAAAGSLRFPEDNSQIADPDHAAVLIQPTAGMANWFSGDGALFAIVRLPREVRQQDVGFGLMGTTGNTNRRTLLHYRRVNDLDRFRWFYRGSGGATLNIFSLVVDEDALLLVGRKSGSDFSLDWYSLLDGSKTAGPVTTNASVAAMVSFGVSDFLIGGIGNGPPTPGENLLEVVGADFEGQWPGEIEAVGYVDRAVSDTEWQDIALGADPLTTLGGANLNFYRHFDGTDASLAAPAGATGDATGAAVKWNPSLLHPGSHFRRQGSSAYLTLDHRPDGFVFGLKPGQTQRSCSFSGTAGGYSGDVELRMVREDGTVEQDWTVVASISGATWAGSLTLPKSGGWCVVQARMAGGGAPLAESRSRIGVGYKFLLLGQSQLELNMSQQARGDHPAVPFGASLLRSFDTGTPILRRLGAAFISDGLAAFMDQFRIFDPSTPVLLQDEAWVGTSMLDFIVDANTARRWDRFQLLIDSYGNDLTAVLHEWGTNDAGRGDFHELLDELVTGNSANYSGDHTLNAALQPGYGFVLMPLTRHSQDGFGNYERTWRLGLAAAQTHGWVTGPFISDLRIEDAGGPHQSDIHPKGNPTLGARLAIGAARAVGADATHNPGFTGTASFGPGNTTITLPVLLPNGGVLSSPTPSALRNIEISEDGGNTFATSGFTAGIAGGAVVLTKTSGAWPAGLTRVRGLPLGEQRTDGDGTAEDAIVDGMLYESWGPDLSGLGLPLSLDLTVTPV